ncbi:MAG: DUF1924 domain-containing protein [Mariprofundaceae bacterium]|nr:DUF1924 domain-containing protein [Mariprofundaceae bacterium]
MKIFTMIITLLLSHAAIANADSVQTLLDQYRGEGATRFDASKGKSMWQEQHFQKKLGKSVSCAACHTSDIRKTGEHMRTGKLIEPMATSVNPGRFQDVKKIKKWFKRNCKWTWGRECSAQEKGDFLSFFRSQ